MRAGVAYVSEDRKGRGLHVSLSSVASMTLPSLDAYTRLGGLRVDSGAERAVAARWIESFAIRCARPDLPISSLSGGNQQKFALARWLETKPKVLVIDEPTRGVDVGSKAEIYEIMRRLASEGVAILMISSDMEEILRLSDRVLVLHEGSLSGELSGSDINEEAIMKLATGA